MKIIDRVFELFKVAGQGAYFGEAVSETEHALQTAHLAVRAGADNDLVAAALLHDVGHLLHGLPETIAARGIDGRHEVGGAAWLKEYFGPGVTSPVRLHVAAKRYLCAADPAYLTGLSEASALSLRLQGGPLDADGMRAFEQEPYREGAIALRHWDDAAKVPGLAVPGLESYRRCLESALLRRDET